MKKYLFTITTIIFLFTVFAKINVMAVVSALDINTQKECEALGGIWNACPLNDCQNSEDYKTGKIECPQVCASPVCEGLVPEETIDLSKIHNESIGHQSQLDDFDILNDKAKEESSINTFPPIETNLSDTQKKDNLNNSNQNQLVSKIDILKSRDFLLSIIGFSIGIILIITGVKIAVKRKLRKH